MSQSSKWETARLCVHIPISVNHLWDTGIHFLQYKESTSHKKVLWSACPNLLPQEFESKKKRNFSYGKTEDVR